MAVEELGSGPPLLFVAGLGYPGGVWDPVVRELSKNHMCLTVSIGGFAGRPVVAGTDVAAVETAPHTAVISDTSRHFVTLDGPAWLVAQIRKFLDE